MNTAQILEKLTARTPPFTALPIIPHKRIIATESEYGVHNLTFMANSHPDEEQPELVLNSASLPAVLQNGGEVYIDCGHIEYAAPETSNAAAAVAYYEAGKVICWKNQYSPQLFCNNTDWYGHTFGTHENRFTCAPYTEWYQLIPFLVARTVFCGAGWINAKNKFEISQRAHRILCAQSTDTLTNRPILNLRDEPLAQVPGWKRLHLICADATMSEVATFLRLGTLSLVVEMLEMRALPNISFTRDGIVHDLHAISREIKPGAWRIKSIQKGPQDVLELLALYLERAQILFSHRDEVTDALLIIWSDTLKKLWENPLLLWRRLDWVAKLRILQIFKEEIGACDAEWLRSQDMEYHSLNPNEGLYYHLRKNEMERMVSNELIAHATMEPPSDTRAHTRGKAVQLLAASNPSLALCANSWGHLAVANQKISGHPRGFQGDPPAWFSISTPDPRERYDDALTEIKRRLTD